MNPLSFLIGFLIFICVVAVVIIGLRWLLKIAGLTVPPELVLIGSILVFIVLLLVCLQFFAPTLAPWHWH